jgi:hypothetical protein
MCVGTAYVLSRLCGPPYIANPLRAEPEDCLRTVDDWRRGQIDLPSRAEAWACGRAVHMRPHYMRPTVYEATVYEAALYMRPQAALYMRLTLYEAHEAALCICGRTL